MSDDDEGREATRTTGAHCHTSVEWVRRPGPRTSFLFPYWGYTVVVDLMYKPVWDSRARFFPLKEILVYSHILIHHRMIRWMFQLVVSITTWLVLWNWKVSDSARKQLLFPQIPQACPVPQSLCSGGGGGGVGTFDEGWKVLCAHTQVEILTNPCQLSSAPLNLSLVPPPQTWL